MSETRRKFFGQLGLIGAGSALVLPQLSRAASPNPVKDRRPRHIIQMVADGMSSGTLSLADHFSWLIRKRGLTWFELARRSGTVMALVNMRSLNSIVTDSSAAASSWGSGSRVVNGTLNVLPDGTQLAPLCSVLADSWWKRGLVTTTEITHATPAGFAVSISSRGSAEDIAEQYLARGIDVLLGGGRKYFAADKRKDKRDLYAAYCAAGYATMTQAADLDKASPDQRWLGTFASGHLPFTLDALADGKIRREVPTLARMTERAISKLERENNFFMMVEGGRVDHGAHASDIAAALHDMLAFDEALDVCLAFQKRVPETLLVITTDHGTGNPGLNGMGDNYGKSIDAFKNIRNIKRSFESLSDKITKKTTASELRKTLKDATGWSVPDNKTGQIIEYLTGCWKPVFDSMNSESAQMGQLLGNYVGVGWTSSAHTADYVPLMACGPGAERFRGFLQNTDVFPNYMALAGIDFRNPTATEQSARG